MSLSLGAQLGFHVNTISCSSLWSFQLLRMTKTCHFTVNSMATAKYATFYSQKFQHGNDPGGIKHLSWNLVLSKKPNPETHEKPIKNQKNPPHTLQQPVASLCGKHMMSQQPILFPLQWGIMSCLTQHCGSFQHVICCHAFTVLLESSQPSLPLALICVFLIINPVAHDPSFRCSKELYHCHRPLPQQHCRDGFDLEEEEGKAGGARTCGAEPPS